MPELSTGSDRRTLVNQRVGRHHVTLENQTGVFGFHDFEPFRIDPDSGVGKPDPDYSRLKAKEFLDKVAAGVEFDSIFLCSVMNSIPFPKDRMVVLVIVNALSTKDTVTYGTCRDISDFEYEYGGIRQANYFKFDAI